MLSLEEGTVLVRRTRQIIESHLDGIEGPGAGSEYSHLLERRGVFVTLLKVSHGGELRGCIGAPYPEGPLLAQLSHVAVEAATRDPRFDPVSSSEFRKKIIVEVTVLTTPELVTVGKPLEYGDRINVGRDGIIVDGLRSRGLLLPQVAVEEGFDAEEFLSQCCLKAGLLPDAWLTGKVQVSRFQGQVFSEEWPGGPVVEKSLKLSR